MAEDERRNRQERWERAMREFNELLTGGEGEK